MTHGAAAAAAAERPARDAFARTRRERADPTRTLDAGPEPRLLERCVVNSVLELVAQLAFGSHFSGMFEGLD